MCRTFFTFCVLIYFTIVIDKIVLFTIAFAFVIKFYHVLKTTKKKQRKRQRTEEERENSNSKYQLGIKLLYYEIKTKQKDSGIYSVKTN